MNECSVGLPPWAAVCNKPGIGLPGNTPPLNLFLSCGRAIHLHNSIILDDSLTHSGAIQGDTSFASLPTIEHTVHDTFVCGDLERLGHTGA